jgi:hypothetical protein
MKIEWMALEIFSTTSYFNLRLEGKIVHWKIKNIYNFINLPQSNTRVEISKLSFYYTCLLILNKLLNSSLCICEMREFL